MRGLLGLNGAGKTTLLRILFGLIRPDAGSVALLGQTLDPRRPAPREGVGGFVEEPAFYPYLTGHANLDLLSRLDDGGGAGIAEALETVGLSSRASDRVGGYSTGMRQRLGIAAALLREPKVLLLDEPTSGLDPAGMRSVTALLRELSAQGVAVILSSHLVSELEAICHSYTILREGRVVWDGAASRLEDEAPGSAYSIIVSDEDRAVELAEGHDGVEAIASTGVPGCAAPRRARCARCVRVRPRPRRRRGSPPRAARQPAREHVLRDDRRRGRDRRARVRRGEARGAGDGDGVVVSAIATTTSARSRLTPRPSRRRGARLVAGAERRKLTAQLPVRLLAVLCLLGPFVFAVLLKAQSGTPSDALFGVWVHSSGFAVSLVVLGFAANWGFPIIAGVLAGDLFAAQDRYGTWKTIITRSRPLEEVFAGKVLAAMAFALALGLLLAGLEPARRPEPRRGAGARRLRRLRELAPAHVLALVSVSWLICMLPFLAYTEPRGAVLGGQPQRHRGRVGPIVVTLADAAARR